MRTEVPMGGYVWLVGAGPGDPDLITMRGHRALREADVVLYDALVEPAMLDGLTAQRLYVGKRCGAHALPQEQIGEWLVRLAREGKRVVRLKGGDPTVFGRGGEEAEALAAAGVPFEVVPGVSSSVAAPAAAGIPVTFRGVAESFTVVTAHRRDDRVGFALPAHDPRATLVLLMGLGTAAAWRAELLAKGWPVDTPVAIVSRGCTQAQRVLTTTLDAVEDAASRAEAPAVVVLGEVVRLRDRLGMGFAAAALAAK